MGSVLSKAVRDKIKETVFKKADEFGYMQCDRPQSGRFMNDLIDDPEVGRVLIEYMPKESVRTYIKDGILNAYTKAVNKKALAASTPEQTIKDVYHETASVIYEGKNKQSGLFVLRSKTGVIYVVSGGTVLKWETALRKALDVIAMFPRFTVGGQPPHICLKLSSGTGTITEADKEHILKAVGAVGVKAVFCAT